MSFITTKASTKISLYVLLVFILGGIILISTEVTDLSRYMNLSTFYLAYLIGGFIGIYTSRKIGLYTYVGKALLFLGIGQIAIFLSAIVWDYYDFILGIKAPDPSIADLFFALFIPFSVAGLWWLLKIYKLKTNIWFIIKALVLVIIVSIIIFYVLGSADIAFGENIFKTFFELFYSISDAILISMAIIILWVGSKRMFQGLAFYAIGLIIIAFANLTYAYRIAEGSYYFGDISELLFIISGIVLSIGIYLTAKNLTEKQLPVL